MAANAFNSVGGYTVNIPPVNIIDTNGNITAPRANISGNLTVGGNAAVSGSITATNFYGNVQGNITANITITGTDGSLLFNDNSLAGSASGVIYDKATKSLTVEENLTANNFSLGLGNNQFYTISSFIATTNSTAVDQVLHRVSASTVISMDYTIIATDTIGNTRQTSKLIASVLGTDVGYYEYGTIDAPISSPGVGDFKVNYESGGIASGNVTLTVTPKAAHLTNYKVLITSYKA
jgi:hypothetical protein